MKYDTVSKLWIQECTEQFLRELVGVEIDQFEPIEETAQEQPSMSKADYVLKAKVSGKAKHIFLLEVLTHWIDDKLIDLARYSLYCKKKFHLPIRPVLVLFLPHSNAKNCYEDECVRFRFQLIRLYDLNAARFFGRNIPELYPLIPLMAGGVEMASEANRRLIESELPRLKKANLLVVLRIFLELRDKEKSSMVFKEQEEFMDVMAESPFFQRLVNLGRKQGREKGLKLGLEKGRQEGRRKGREEGLKEGFRRTIRVALEIRFGKSAAKILPALEKCSELDLLEKAAEAVKTVKSLEEFHSSYLP